jgi:hypothetical protein
LTMEGEGTAEGETALVPTVDEPVEEEEEDS